MELRAAEVGARSTLWASRDGALFRQYHDTDTWHVVEPRVDARGALVTAHNRRVEAVARDAFADDDTYRGARGARRPPHPHLRRALACLVRTRPRDIATYAAACNVAPATAWCYAARVVERWPAAADDARGLVYPPLLEAMEGVDTRGTLRDVMARLEAGGLRGDPRWREVTDRHAHLRLARLITR